MSGPSEGRGGGGGGGGGQGRPQGQGGGGQGGGRRRRRRRRGGQGGGAPQQGESANGNAPAKAQGGAAAHQGGPREARGGRDGRPRGDGGRGGKGQNRGGRDRKDKGSEAGPGSGGGMERNDLRIARPDQKQEKEAPFKHVVRRYGLVIYDSLAAAKADLGTISAKATEVDQLNVVLRAEGGMDDPELNAVGKVKVFAGTAWTLIHERRQTDGWYDEPR